MMRYCPICWTERRLYSLYGRVSWWWHYKILKEPEPDPVETLMDIMPTIFSAMVGLECAKVLNEEVDKMIEKRREERRKTLKI